MHVSIAEQGKTCWARRE